MMEEEYNFDFETIMTLGQSAVVGMENQYQLDDYYQELPRPDGEGWELLQILPVHNNKRFLQYFWQRKFNLNHGDGEGQIKDTNFNLTV